MQSYGTVAAVNESNLTTEVVAYWYTVVLVKDGAPALSFFAQHCNDLLQQGYTILEWCTDL